MNPKNDRQAWPTGRLVAITAQPSRHTPGMNSSAAKAPRHSALPALTAYRTASSISRWLVTPTTFRNLRISMLNVSSFMGRLRCAGCSDNSPAVRRGPSIQALYSAPGQSHTGAKIAPRERHEAQRRPGPRVRGAGLSVPAQRLFEGGDGPPQRRGAGPPGPGPAGGGPREGHDRPPHGVLRPDLEPGAFDPGAPPAPRR